MDAFPNDPWSLVTASSLKPLEMLPELCTHIQRLYAAPRDFTEVCAFLKDELPSGSLLIHGAGTHTDAIWETLESRSDVSVLGFIDQRAGQIEHHRGLPVYTPEEAASLNVDRILLSHTCREQDMFLADRRAGVSEAHLFPIYTHETYVKRSLAKWRERLDDLEPFPFVIIRAARLQILEDAVLKEIFPPEQTQSLFIGRAEYLEQSPVYPALDLGQSLTLLQDCLTALKPRVVYLSTGWYNNFLIPVIRQMLPNARLICEIFDWGLLLPRNMMAPLGHDLETDGANRLGEYAAIHQADLVLSKRQGPWWERVQAEFKVPYRCYYPGARSAQTLERIDEAMCRIVYGGILPPEAELSSFTHDYDFLPLLQQLSQDERFEVSIYNSLHESPRDDAVFASYRERFGDVYHARVAYGAFLDKIKSCDYGWLATVGRKDMHLDRMCVVTHRAVGYLAAGLPMIVDRGWGRLAQLVEDFQAGLVLDDFDQESLIEALLGADRAAHQEGAARLAQHLVRMNRELVQEMIEWVGDLTEAHP